MDSLSKTKVTSRFQTIYELGSGAFGRVEKVYDRQNNDVRAIKIIKPDGDSSDYTREVNLLQRLSHPNIVAFHESFRVDSELYIVMEFCGNSNLSTHKPRMTEAFLMAIVRDMASALAEIHSKNLIHFDVKPQNVLLSSIGEAKLSDFGVTSRADSTVARDQCAKPGTMMYMAPELLAGKQATSAADIWALGITAFEMAVGVPIALTGAETIDEWFANHDAVFVADGQPWSHHFTRLLRRMLTEDPNKRITAQEILAIPQLANIQPTWLIAGDIIEPDSQIFWDE
jgi:serine/threonine protein kinase